jgi:Tfp pilus assembly protein PilO
MIDNILLILFVALAVLLFLYFFKNKSVNIKSKVIKKEELKENYKNQMITVLRKYDEDKTKQIQEKIKLLKQINAELSMNLFFDEQEAKDFLKELSNIS